MKHVERTTAAKPTPKKPSPQSTRVTSQSAAPTPVHQLGPSGAVKRRDSDNTKKGQVPKTPPFSPRASQRSGSSPARKSGSSSPAASVRKSRVPSGVGQQQSSPTPTVHTHKRKPPNKVKQHMWDHLGIALGSVFVTVVVTGLVIIRALVNEKRPRAERMGSYTSTSRLPHS
ncbi:hypothetical protein MTO96_023423 [Rhipicephalus appendiculatus]